MADKDKLQSVGDLKTTCKFCKKSVTSTIARCVTCEACYHTSCALRIAGLVAVGKDNLVKCCSSKLTPLTLLEETSNTNNTTYLDAVFKELLNAKEEIITELREKQGLLYKTIKLLENKHNDSVKDGSQSGDKPQKTSVDKLPNTDKMVNKQLKENNKIPGTVWSNINSQHNSRAEMETVQRRKMQEVIDLGAGLDGDDRPDNYQTVTYGRKKSFPKKRFGTGDVTEEEKTSGFVGGDRKAWIYIYRVKSHVTEEMVKSHVQKKPGFGDIDIGVKEIVHEGKKYDFKSFSVSVPFDKKDELYQPEFWPANIGIKRFNLKLYKKSRPGANFL